MFFTISAIRYKVPRQWGDVWVMTGSLHQYNCVGQKQHRLEVQIPSGLSSENLPGAEVLRFYFKIVICRVIYTTYNNEAI